MSQGLYNYLSEKGHYTKSYMDFVKQFANRSAQEKLYNFMAENGDYTKGISAFYDQFFKKIKAKKVEEPEVEETESTVGKSEVKREIESERLTKEEEQEVINKSNIDFNSGYEELGLQEEKVEGAKKHLQKFEEGAKRNRADARYIPSPTGGGGVYVWPDGYEETAFEYGVVNLKTGEEADLDKASMVDVTKTQYISEEAQEAKEAIKKAKEILENQNKSLPENEQVPITNEAVKEKAKEIVIQNNKDKKFVEKLEDNVDFELIGKDPDQKRKIKEARSLQEQNKKDLENTLKANKKAREKLKTLSDKATGLKDKPEFKAAKKLLQSAQKAYEKNPTIETQTAYNNAYNNYKQVIDRVNNEYGDINELYDEYYKAAVETQGKYEELVKTDKDLALYLDAYGRDQSLLWGHTFGKLAVTLGDMGVSLLELKDKISLPVLIQQGIKQAEDWGYDLGENGDTLEAGLTYFNNHVKPLFGGSSVEQRRQARAYLTQARNGLAKAPAFTEIGGLGDFGSYMADLAFNQAPNLALMYYTGGASLYAMGAVSAGGKFGEYEDLMHEDGIGISPLQMYTAATLTGVTEALSERITLGQIGRFKTAMASSSGLRRGVGEYLTKQLFSGKGIFNTVSEGVQEGTSEMVAQLSSNALDNSIGIETNPYEGVKESFWSGFMMSTMLFKAPVAGKNLYNALEGKDANQKIGERQARLMQLGKLLNSDSLSPKLRDKYIVEHQKVTKEIHNIQTDEISKLDQMSNREKKGLLDIAREKYDLRKQKDDILNDTSLDIETKQAEIYELDNIISKLDVRKNEIIAPYYFKDTVDEIKIQADAIGAATGKTSRVTTMDADQIAESLLEEQARIRAEIAENQQFLGTEQDAIARQNIQDYQNQLNEYDNANTQFGYTVPLDDGGFEVVLNKDKPMMGTAAHELMHAVLFKTIGQDSNIQANMGDALVDHVATLGGNNTVIGRRMQAYGKWSKDKDGKDVFVRDSNFGEESIAVISEGINDGTLDYNEGLFGKLGNIIRRTLQDKLGKRVRFDSGRDVYNFIKDFNKSIKDRKVSKAIVRVAAEGAKGKLARGVKVGDKAIQYSKDAFEQAEVAEDLGLKATTAKIVAKNASIEKAILKEGIKNEDGDIIASSARQQELVTNNLPRAFALARQAAGKANDLTLEEALKMNDVMEWYSEYSLKLAELARTYKARRLNKDTNKIEKISFGAYMNTLLPKKYTGILDKLKGKIKTDRIDDPDVAKKIGRMATPTTTLSNMEVEGKKIALNTINQNKVQKKIINVAKKNPTLSKLRKYKEVKTEITKYRKFTKDGVEITDKNKKQLAREGIKEVKSKRIPTGKLYDALVAVSEIFGVDPMRIIQEQDLDTTMRKSAQDVILAKTNEIIAMMPFGTTASGDATGIANTKLGIFFKKLARTKMKATGTGKGLAKQQKQNIDPKKFRELVGLIKDGRINNTSVDGAIRAVIVQVASIASNQAVRQVYGPDTLQLKDGKASTMFSKRYGEPRIQFSNDADLSRLMKIENAMFPEILKNFGQDSIDMKSEEGRADLENWIYNTMSNYLPFSFFKHSGNWTGTTNAIRDKDGNIIRREHKSNLLYRNVPELHNAIQESIDSGIAWQGEALPEKDKQDIANALKRVAYNDTNLKDSDFKASKLRGFELIWKQFDQMIKDTPAKAKYIAALLSSSASQQNHFMRTGSLQEFKNILNEENREEHTQAASDLGKFLFNRLMQGNIDTHLAPALNAYFQGSLPKRYDDLLKGDGFNYKDDAGEYSWPILLGVKSAWIRYFNPNVNNNSGGIDPNVIVLANGNTIAQEHGVDVDAKLLTSEVISKQQQLLFEIFNGDKTVAQAEQYINSFANVEFTEGIKSKTQFLKAVVNARIFFSKPTKGMSAWDFDDTLARTKSGVRYTLPNPEGTPQPSRKVVFMAGGPGSGKSTVIKGLDLKNQGFKVVNQDISLQWLAKNHGLPTDMRDFTPAQASKWGELTWDARLIAKRKQSKYQGKGDGIIVDGTGNSLQQMKNHVREFKSKGYDVQMVFVETSLETALERNRVRKERSLRDGIVKRTHESVQNNKESFRELFGNNFAEVKTDNLKIGDPMPQSVIGKMDNFTKGYIKGRLSAEEFANDGASILEQGGEFDFSEFDIVKEGKKGPLFDKAMDRAKKYGVKDNYILTASPHAAKISIFRFLQAQGLNIPFDNIITLENSTSEAKALWMAEKVGEGYNDMYFADDALQNIQAVDNMLNQFDVKSKVQQAKIQFSKDANSDFNNILEQTKGLPADYKISQAKARQRGKKIGRLKLWIPPSADDFAGLLQMFQGKGKQGMEHGAWIKKNLLDPFARGDRSLNGARQRTADEFKALRKKFPEVSKKLRKIIPTGDYNHGDAMRVYLWDKAGMEIPGLSKTDKRNMLDLVNNNPDLQAFADVLGVISRKEDGYIAPDEYWMTKDIVADITEDGILGDGRKDHLAEWIENKNLIFTPENLNKVEFLYGSNFREALEDIL